MGQLILYDKARMTLTKDWLEDLRKWPKWLYAIRKRGTKNKQ